MNIIKIIDDFFIFGRLPLRETVVDPIFFVSLYAIIVLCLLFLEIVFQNT